MLLLIFGAAADTMAATDDPWLLMPDGRYHHRSCVHHEPAQPTLPP